MNRAEKRAGKERLDAQLNACQLDPQEWQWVRLDRKNGSREGNLGLTSREELKGELNRALVKSGVMKRGFEASATHEGNKPLHLGPRRTSERRCHSQVNSGSQITLL
ncbi:hypothetical protein AbraIFM66950_000228, partial [Aspergillus brasiliensis]